MHRLTSTRIALLVLLCLAGCSRQSADKPAGDKPGGDKPQAQIDARQSGGDKPDGGKKADGPVDPSKLPVLPLVAVDEKQEKYEAALNDALELLAKRDFPEALVALEAARHQSDNEFIRGEIAKVKQRLDQESAARTTAQNIETVLAEGKATEAAQLSAQALKEFGGSSDANALVKLRLQADALASVQKNEDAGARFNRFRGQGEAALAEKNLRAAALAFEQAVLARQDAAVQQKLDGIRASLEKYDALRAKAAELRKDPAQLEEALAALQAAQEAWDTLQVRQELDEYTLALQKRRDTLSVADFELRADLGLPEMGRSIAEELLPLFKPRFDLVERAQLGKVMSELKLERSLLDDPAQQRELAKLAKVRYLVLGSIYPLTGVTVQARLVDVKTGLVVQTAKVVAPTPQDAFALLPELAKQLMMSDEEKMAYDAAMQQRLVKAPVVIDEAAPLPPFPAAQPAAVELELPPLPVFGELKLEAFRGLPPPPAAGIALPPPVIEAGVEVRFKKRLLAAALQRGDVFFRAGNFAEANRQFEFALNLAPGHADVLLRIDRVRPLLAPPPPPQVALIVPAPVVIVQPRIAILPFFVSGNPRVVPPGLGPWVPQQLAPYLSANFDIVDPALVYWYMGSLGITVSDLMTDPAARLWLGRAVGARYFLLGTIEQTASFDVTTYLVDAEFGFLQGSGRIHVHNTFELRLRLGELAQLTLMDPVERQGILAQAQAYDALVLKGRLAMQRREFAIAEEAFEQALRLRPGAIDVRCFLHEARRAQRQQALEQRRLQILFGPQFAVAEAQRRQWEIARQCEQARLVASQQNAVLGEDQRLLIVQQRVQAQTVLVKQAQLSFQTRNFRFSVSVFESAVALAPAPDIVGVPVPVAAVDPWRELAMARLEADRQAQLVQAQFIAIQENALRKQREQELAAAQVVIAEQQRKIEALRQAQLQRDKKAYVKALAEGQEQLGKGNFDAAAGALLVAQRLNRTAAVDNLLDLTNQRRAETQAKTDAERQALEARLDAERAKRKAAELEAKRNRDLYVQTLELAQTALQKKDYPAAQAKLEAAGAIFKTDVVLSGLKQVAAARTQDEAALKAQQLEQDRAVRMKQLVAQGQAAIKEKQYAAAVQTFQEARKLDPKQVDALAGLTQAEHGRDQQLALERKKADDATRADSFQRLLKSGQANLAAKQHEAAVANLTEALKLKPGEPVASAALKQAQQASSAPAADTKSQQKVAAYQKLIADGRLALSGKRYEDAIKAFSDAQSLMPGDQASRDFLGDAQKGKKDAAEALAAAAQKRAAEQKRVQDLQKALTLGRSALAGRDLEAAAKALAQAQQLAPDDGEVQRALKDLAQAQTQAKQDAAAKAAQAAQATRLQDLLKSAQTALKGKDLTAAAKALSEASQLDPANPTVKQGLRDIELARAADADHQKRMANYQATLAAGQKAMQAKNYSQAVKDFSDAAKLLPDDTRAPLLLKQAQQAWNDAKVADARVQEAEAAKQKLELQRKAQFSALLKEGSAKLSAKLYPEARSLFQEALKLYPSDQSAQLGLRQANQGLEDSKVKPPPPKDTPKDNKALFQKALQDGQRYLDAGRFVDAQREFEAALRISPNDATAKKLLEKAKQMKK
jgi:tetratricopeptide (TPR) repeat protein